MMMSACRIVLILSLVSLLLPAMLAKSQQARRRRGAGPPDKKCNPVTGENCPPPTPARRRRGAGADMCNPDNDENCPPPTPARKRRDTKFLPGWSDSATTFSYTTTTTPPPPEYTVPSWVETLDTARKRRDAVEVCTYEVGEEPCNEDRMGRAGDGATNNDP